ncbi:MAG: ThiF family adenylyltransferase [Promethearchaeota archaeon]
MRKLRIMFLGCGFLTSHLIPQIIPFVNHFILVDFDRLEMANYENSLFPKFKYETRSYKVSALASLIEILSSAPVTPIATKITKMEQLMELKDKFEPEFVFVTFDNLESRLIAQKFCLEANIPSLFIGVTEDYIYIDWHESLVVPIDKETIERVNREVEQIHDVCSRINFRGLGALASALAYDAFFRWLTENKRVAYIATTEEMIRITMLKR